MIFNCLYFISRWRFCYVNETTYYLRIIFGSKYYKKISLQFSLLFRFVGNIVCIANSYLVHTGTVARDYLHTNVNYLILVNSKRGLI